jgi:hypothetical protein
MITCRIFLWYRLIIPTVTKNRPLFFVSAVLNNRQDDRHKKSLFLISAVLSNRHQKYHFWCRLLKIIDTKITHNCTSLGLDPYLLSLDQLAVRMRIVCFFLPLAPIHTKASSLSLFNSLSLMPLGRDTNAAGTTAAHGAALLWPPR